MGDLIIAIMVFALFLYMVWFECWEMPNIRKKRENIMNKFLEDK